MICKYFFEFVFFVGVGIEKKIGFKGFNGVFFVFFAIVFPFATASKNFIEIVGYGADNVGFAEVGAGGLSSIGTKNRVKDFKLLESLS